MKFRAIQNKIRTGRYTITDHALIESFKDGVDLNDILHVVLTGRVVETYPGRQRLLIGGRTAKKKRLHVVVEDTGGEPAVVTVYAPDSKLWMKGRVK